MQLLMATQPEKSYILLSAHGPPRRRVWGNEETLQTSH